MDNLISNIMKVKIVDTYFSVCNGRKVKNQVINLFHRDLAVGVSLSIMRDCYEVSARDSGSGHVLLSAVHFTKDYFPSRKALYEYILTLAKTYGKN